jgi:uncharacterized membrane protein YhhN
MAQETIYKYMIGFGLLFSAISIIFADLISPISLYLFAFGCVSFIVGVILWIYYSQRKKKEEYTKDEMLKLIGK